MPKQPKKRPHEMTTHEAMEHLFSQEGAKHIRRAVAEHDAKDDSSDQGKDSNDHRTN